MIGLCDQFELYKTTVPVPSRETETLEQSVRVNDIWWLANRSAFVRNIPGFPTPICDVKVAEIVRFAHTLVKV